MLIDTKATHVQLIHIRQQHRGSVCVDCTVPHATPWSAATSATARPESITADNSAVRSRVVQRARTGDCSVAGVNVPRGHSGSAHTSRGLRTITSSWPACGMSRTRCTIQACTRAEITPHAGQPWARSTGCALTRRPPNGKSTASTTR
jgi:hypothetical protein